MMAVLCYSFRMATQVMTVDHKARMTGPATGVLPDGTEFQIFTDPHFLRGKRDITDYKEIFYPHTTRREQANLAEMAMLCQHMIMRNKR